MPVKHRKAISAEHKCALCHGDLRYNRKLEIYPCLICLTGHAIAIAERTEACAQIAAEERMDRGPLTLRIRWAALLRPHHLCRAIVRATGRSIMEEIDRRFPNENAPFPTRKQQ